MIIEKQLTFDPRVEQKRYKLIDVDGIYADLLYSKDKFGHYNFVLESNKSLSPIELDIQPQHSDRDMHVNSTHHASVEYTHIGYTARFYPLPLNVYPDECLNSPMDLKVKLTLMDYEFYNSYDELVMNYAQKEDLKTYKTHAILVNESKTSIVPICLEAKLLSATEDQYVYETTLFCPYRIQRATSISNIHENSLTNSIFAGLCENRTVNLERASQVDCIMLKKETIEKRNTMLEIVKVIPSLKGARIDYEEAMPEYTYKDMQTFPAVIIKTDKTNYFTGNTMLKDVILLRDIPQDLLEDI
jgi:hypothetical protein